MASARPKPDRTLSRRAWLSATGTLCAAGAVGLSGIAGCSSEAPSDGRLEKVWGRQGTSPGRFQKPRAIAIDAEDRLYIVDMTARIQVFTRDGEYLRHWQTPEWANGKPSGLAINREGHLCVADTHYQRMLVYTLDGKLLSEQVIAGAAGQRHGEFGFLTDCAEDSHGNYYLSEYGENDRIQKFTCDGAFVLQIGGPGEAPGEFMRPQKIAMDADDRLWVADACNHRIQVFDCRGESVTLMSHWGSAGTELGQLRYPYDLLLDGQGHLYVAEFGNSRVQKFTLSGESLGAWGTHGRRAGELFNPWGVARDSQGRLHIVDSYNHRVQQVWF